MCDTTEFFSCIGARLNVDDVPYAVTTPFNFQRDRRSLQPWQQYMTNGARVGTVAVCENFLLLAEKD